MGYISWPSACLFMPALSYFAVCRGTKVGFVELFHEVRTYINDPVICWNLCCKIKRGLVDTSLPGAYFKEQVYFQGVTEILQHLDNIDFLKLYSGQISWKDLHVVPMCTDQ